MKRIFSLSIFLCLLLSRNFISAQEEQSTRDASVSDRYWNAPRIQSEPAIPPQKFVSQLAQSLTIENEILQATWVRGKVSVVFKSSGSTFLDGDLKTIGMGKIISVTDKTFGQGQGIEIGNYDGSRDTLMLFPNQPFLFLRTTFTNSGTQSLTISFVRPFQAAVKLGKPAAQLKTFGSAGLTAPDKNPGSYDWLAVVEPETRNGVVFGYLTSERGCGVLFDKVDGDVVNVGAQIDYGRLVIAPGKSAESETLAIGYFGDARFGLEAYADTIAKIQDIHLPPQPTVYCTWYSQPYGGAADEKHFLENAAFAKTNLAPFGFSVAQIDDGWQSGFKRTSPSSPKKGFLTNNPTGPYPSGMKATADNIKNLGLKPGIWFMPFAGTSVDPYFTNHLDWFAKTPSGEPYDTPWGGTCLDMTYAPAREHLREVVNRICNEWGYQYIKIDGLWTGTATKQLYVDSGYKEDDIGAAVFHDPNISNIEAYRSGLKLVRETAGKNVFILGCNTPQNMRVYLASMGLVDGMRVGPDNKASWSAMMRGPTFATRNYFLNGRVWYNDPDPLYARDSVPLNEARALASWVAISGAMNTSSEWYSGLSAGRLDLLKRTMPAHGLLTARPVDIFENDLPRIWLLQAPTTIGMPGDFVDNSRNIVGLFNWDETDAQFDEPLAKIGLDENREYVAFDYWQNQLLPNVKGDLKISVPAHSCAVLSLRPVSNHPQVISTSRHITQGIVDLISEQWDSTTKTLSGRSKIVGGDNYELRIVTPDNNWNADTLQINGVHTKSDFTQTNNLVRVTIESPANGEISWSVRFK